MTFQVYTRGTLDSKFPSRSRHRGILLTTVIVISRAHSGNLTRRIRVNVFISGKQTEYVTPLFAISIAVKNGRPSQIWRRFLWTRPLFLFRDRAAINYLPTYLPYGSREYAVSYLSWSLNPIGLCKPPRGSNEFFQSLPDMPFRIRIHVQYSSEDNRNEEWPIVSSVNLTIFEAEQTTRRLLR